MIRNRYIAVSIAIVLLVAGALSVTVAATGGSVSSSGPNSANPGDQVTVSLELTNSGDEDSSHYLEVDKPASWDIVSRDDDGADWSSARQTWSWDVIRAGQSKNPSITLTIPEDAESGTYEVRGTAGDRGGDKDSTLQEIIVESQQTSTPTPTSTPTSTDEGGSDSTPTESSDSTDGDGGSGGAGTGSGGSGGSDGSSGAAAGDGDTSGDGSTSTDTGSGGDASGAAETTASPTGTSGTGDDGGSGDAESDGTAGGDEATETDDGAPAGGDDRLVAGLREMAGSDSLLMLLVLTAVIGAALLAIYGIRTVQA